MDMKRILMLGVMAVTFASFAAPRKVALVVQNHTSDAPTLPMAAFADTLTSRLSGKTLRVVNPHNVIGVNQNRTAKGEEMPEASAQEIARMTGADGVVTASIQEFTGEDIGVPAIAHSLKVRIALNLVDAATGETVCGIDGVEFSKNYTAEKVKSDTATLYEGLMHLAAAKASEKFLARVASVGWEQNAAKTIEVFFGCNVLGADVQIDGLSYGTCPAQLTLTPGIHNVLVSYPPYYYEFKRKAMFNQEGQTYKVVLQITKEGEKERRSGALFDKQLAFADAMLERYNKSGATDDYVRKTIAVGTAIYWKNSFGRIAITDGFADNIQFATPVTKTGDVSVPPKPDDIAQGLKDLLMKQMSD
ncbi:MAG: PEGA domain-containing protein [Kiritimatiellae bacterium]|nr:PEGA domain-containing protein [Kiritimatiellia bacterium]